MATTLTLGYKRFVAQVSNGSVRAKASYLAMMAENETALQACDWHEATAKAGDVALPDNNPFEAAGYLNDKYDAYIQGGRGSQETAQFEGFAGMSAYRFTLPASYVSGAQRLTSLSINVSRDRYLRAGVRIVAVVSNSATPSTNWAVVRGENGNAYKTSSETPSEPVEGVRTFGLLGQPSETYLINTRVAEDTLTFVLDSGSGIDATKGQYLWLYVSLEDYQNRWLWRSQGVKREYWIEGSAMLVGSSNAVTFSADVQSDEEVAIVLNTGGVANCGIEFPRRFLCHYNIGMSSHTDFEEVASNYGYVKGYGDTAYQVSSGNIKDYELTDKEVFKRLRDLSKVIGTENGGVARYPGWMELTETSVLETPLKQLDRRTLTPFYRTDNNQTTGDLSHMGLGVRFMKATSIPSILLDNQSFKIAHSSFLQVAAMTIPSTTRGKRLTMQAVEACTNTGVTVKFAVYKAPISAWKGANAFCNMPMFLLSEGITHNEKVGSQITVPAATVEQIKDLGGLNAGGYKATLLGVSERVTGTLAIGSEIIIDCAEEITEEDMLIILPIPLEISGNATNSTYLFGFQSFENPITLAKNWFRALELCAWCPKITLA